MNGRGGNVQQIIQQLNYTPNSRARGLRSRCSYLIGLIYDMPTLHMNDVQKGIVSVCTGVGYDIVVHPCEFGSVDLVRDVQAFIQRSKVDGVMVLPPVSENREVTDALDRIGVPHVHFASKLSNEPWRQVVTNYGPAVTDMTNHLVSLGHTRIGFISGPERQCLFAETASGICRCAGNAWPGVAGHARRRRRIHL